MTSWWRWWRQAFNMHWGLLRWAQEPHSPYTPPPHPRAVLSEPSKPRQRLNLNTFPNPSSGYPTPRIVVDQDPSALLKACQSIKKVCSRLYIYSINWSLCISVFPWLSVPCEAPAGLIQSLSHSYVYHRQSVCMRQQAKERERETWWCWLTGHTVGEII